MLIPSPNFVSLNASNFATCGLTAAGGAYCFGESLDGILGSPNAQPLSALVPVDGNHVFRTLSSGYQNACGITTANETWCWGRNYDLSLPIGPSASTTTPVMVTSTAELTFQYMEHGFSHSCGLTRSGLVDCWGNFSYGQLADGRDATSASFPWSLVPVIAQRAR